MRTEMIFLNGKEMKKPLKLLIAVLYSIIFLILVFCLYAEKVNRDLSDSMLRLHIVANSDSLADQDLKYKVRDAVISFMDGKMGSLLDRKDAESYIRGHIAELEAVANSVIQSNGFNETAKVSIGKFPFATKRYGNMVLPAGFYDALKIEIGEAKGQNWWCVMFPPLCFVDDTRGELKEEYVGILEKELTDEEMNIIMASESGDELPVEIKFRIVEIFQESKIKLAGLFRGIIRFN